MEQLKKVAVVEDNPDNRLLVRALLEDIYEIREYENGQDALEGLHRESPDVVLMDISLPGMDGTVILQKIRSDDGLHALPVIAITAHAMAGDREKYLSLGFDDYLSKPITDETLLLAAISGCIEGTAGHKKDSQRK